MGTNYYLAGDICPHCGRSDEREHIGKSSADWHFALHIYPDKGINNLDDWKDYWRGHKIVDEYGKKISHKAMLKIITEREGCFNWDSCPQQFYRDWDEFHRINYSEQGLNGLVRCKIDGEHCIGHGDGTYDYIVGEFC